MKALAALAVLLSANLDVAAQTASVAGVMPPGVRVRMTIDGPVFVDPKGMTLYRMNSLYSSAPESCNQDRHAVILESLEGSVGFTVPAPDIQARRSCLQKRPALRAASDAQPVGKWSIQTGADGLRQWAYDGAPLHTSIKDRLPGEINGTFPPQRNIRYPWTLALAPLSAVPPGIATRKLAAGLALASSAGKVLYHRQGEQTDADPNLWRPLAAAAQASAVEFPDWSMIQRKDGLQQWAYRGKPLYTFAGDASPQTIGKQILDDTFGAYGQRLQGWHVTLLKQPPRHPTEVSIGTIMEGNFEYKSSTARRIYTDAKGMTLYTIHCIENTKDKLDCDDIGDSPGYWLNFCGGEQRCGNTWHALAAPPGAKPIDDLWSVLTIDPRHPWRPLSQDAPRSSVWAYRGRPVFTYAGDEEPGDFNAATPIDGPPPVVHARTLFAYEPE